MRPMRPLVAESPVRRASPSPVRREKPALKPVTKTGRAARVAAPLVRPQSRLGERPRPPNLFDRLRERVRRLDRRDKIRASAAFATVVFLVGGTLVGLTGAAGIAIASSFRQASIAAGLTVQNVTVVGRRDTPSSQVLAALGVRRGAPILDIDTEAARARLEELGWVRTAVVTRLLPNTLHVQLVERSPMAVWQNDGKRMLVDRDGHVIEGEAKGPVSGLPLVVGEGAPAHAAEILSTLALEPKLAQRVTAAIRVGDRRWDVKLDNGVTVRLPEADEASAWRRLAALDREHGLLGRAIEAVDMRLADRLVVRMTEEAAKIRLGPAKNT